jgi:hypothetical protein
MLSLSIDMGRTGCQRPSSLKYGTFGPDSNRLQQATSVAGNSSPIP